MKKYILFLFSLWTIQAIAQTPYYNKFSTEVISFNNGTLFSDSDFVDRLIKDKRIILLGEIDHGDGSSFEAKTALIKYLHEKHGFNKLVFESGIVGCNELWKSVEAGKSASELAKDYIYYIWSQVKETENLFHYIDDEFKKGTPLKIVGIDPQFSGIKNEQAFIEILRSKLDSSEIESSKFKAFSHELEIMSKWLQYPEKDQHQISEATFNAHLVYYQEKVLALENEEDEQLMNVYFENIKTLASIKWEKRTGGFEQRDLQMFRNLNYWLAPDEKVIVWAANAHIIRNDDQLKGKDSDYSIIGLKKLGDHIFSAFPEDSYSIAISASSGKTLNFMNKNKTNKIGKHKSGSLEEYLKELECAFVDLKLFEATMKLNEYESQLFYPNVKCISKWSTNFDAILFMDEVKPSTPLW